MCVRKSIQKFKNQNSFLNISWIMLCCRLFTILLNTVLNSPVDPSFGCDTFLSCPYHFPRGLHLNFSKDKKKVGDKAGINCNMT